MAKQSTGNAVVAQMVRDAIQNETRKDEYGNPIMSNVLERAKAWYGRLKELHKKGDCHCGISEKVSFEEFLCDARSQLRILDFWEGDIVECHYGHPGHMVGVIRKTIVGMDSSYASVLFADGSKKDVDEGCIFHSSIPGEILDVAIAQLIASKKCPFMNKEGSENDIH